VELGEGLGPAPRHQELTAAARAKQRPRLQPLVRARPCTTFLASRSRQRAPCMCSACLHECVRTTQPCCRAGSSLFPLHTTKALHTSAASSRDGDAGSVLTGLGTLAPETQHRGHTAHTAPNTGDRFGCTAPFHPSGLHCSVQFHPSDVLDLERVRTLFALCLHHSLCRASLHLPCPKDCTLLIARAFAAMARLYSAHQYAPVCIRPDVRNGLRNTWTPASALATATAPNP